MRDGFTVNEARSLFAEDATNGATNEQRRRYSFKGGSGNHAMRRFQQKHPDLLPPAPAMLSNPVVRKAIHEVKRHVQEHIRKFGCKPDRVMVELVREARQSAVVRNKKLSENREREEEKRKIIEEFGLAQKTKNQQNKAVDRVRLCREQRGMCAYSGQVITERIAAEGNGLEIDHIIPQSRGGTSFLNNLLLCFDGTNRGKTNQTPKEWLTDEQFREFERRLRHLKEENYVKWDNLHKDAPDLDEFVASQLTDAAYAAKQVVNWVRDTLYDGERDGIKRVFTTSGRYTALLRRDWQLFPDSKRGEPFEKDRSDHRHHALDAVAIALSGPGRVKQISLIFQEREKAEAEGKKLMERPPIEPPWGDVENFRAQVMNEWKKLIVSHRPAARKIIGAFHNDTQYGPILDKDGNLVEQFTIRKFAIELTPNHLRVPDGWEELRKKMENCSSKRERKSIRLEMLKLPDVKPEKSGVVRDRWFREEIRGYLRNEGLDPDNFSKKDIKKLIKEKGVFLKSRVPIRQFTLLRSPTVVTIPRKQWNPNTGKIEYDSNPKAIRAYEPQNNHHIEIRENGKGKWTGEVITNFDAAKRVNPPKSSGVKSQPAVNRNDTEEGKFIMSLSIGEMMYMKHPETKEPGYFVIFKIDGTGAIHFTPHFDAGRDKETEKVKAREDVRLSASQLQTLGVEPDGVPQKVWINPLGEVKELIRD
jgi:CRISPR-associated endonuclease Csn1